MSSHHPLRVTVNFLLCILFHRAHVKENVYIVDLYYAYSFVIFFIYQYIMFDDIFVLWSILELNLFQHLMKIFRLRKITLSSKYLYSHHHFTIYALSLLNPYTHPSVLLSIHVVFFDEFKLFNNSLVFHWLEVARLSNQSSLLYIYIGYFLFILWLFSHCWVLRFCYSVWM